MQEDCQLLSLKALFRATQKVYPNTSWDGTMQLTQLPASQSNSPFQVYSESLILFEAAPAATFLHWRPLHDTNNYHSCTRDHFPAEAATSPAPATIFLYQQIPADTSNYQSWTSDPFPAPADTSNYQSWTSNHFPAPADTSNYQSWTSDHLLAPVDTSPKPATIFLHQQKPVLHQLPSFQQILVLYQLSRPAAVTRSCSNDHHPASAIVRRTLFWLRFAIIKFGLSKQHPCFVILA